MTDLQNENALTTVNDNDLAALTSAARDLLPSDIVGLPLRFIKGRWFVKEGKDQEIDVGPTELHVVDVLSYREGWVRWQDKKPTHKIMGRRIDGFVSPPRHALPEYDKEEWPITVKGPADPWQETLQIVLRNVATDQLVTWVTTSWGGRSAIGELLDAFVAESKNRRGKMPVVLLESYDRPTADYGKVATPRLKVVGWEPFGVDASPPGDPAQGRAMRQMLEQLQMVALPKPAAPANDSIPF